MSKQQRQRNFSEEIFEARKFIRSLELFCKDSCELFSLDATPVELDSDALFYIENGLENQQKYFKAFLHDSLISLPTLTITVKDLVITPKNIKVARETVLKKIESLKGPSHNFFKKHVKSCTTIEDLSSLYKTVQDTIRLQYETNIESFDDVSEDFETLDEEDTVQ